jgi:lipid II:glycine glycyltransferase (peptidoglycan interpeptide bridge formation enzyme)
MTDAEMPEFYRHLCISKAKHNVKPVHTLEELLDLRHNRIAEEVKFRALWMRDPNAPQKETFVAGMMLFDFANVKVRHAQYIAPNEEIREFQPTTAMYINVMREAAKDGIQKFSWGTSNGMAGGSLNLPLFKFKESLGAKASLNLIYRKEF